jgi:hypothetical protein
MPKKTDKTLAQRASGIKVVSDGTLPGTKILNAKTGKAIGLVHSLDIHLEVGKVPFAMMRIACPEVLIEDIVLRNGSVDEPVCKYARDCRERARIREGRAEVAARVKRTAKKKEKE